MTDTELIRYIHEVLKDEPAHHKAYMDFMFDVIHDSSVYGDFKKKIEASNKAQCSCNNANCVDSFRAKEVWRWLFLYSAGIVEQWVRQK